MAKRKSEYEVEIQFIERLKELGYSYVELKDYEDVLKNFRKQLCIVNKEALIEAKGEDRLSDSEFERVLLRLENKTIYESAKILREDYVLTLDNGKIVYLKFLTDNTDRNTYQVTHQVTMDPDHVDDVIYKNRYDVTILINGLPLVQIELKRPGVELNEAINQINRYRRFSFRGLFRYIQIFVVSNGAQTKYFANANENLPNNERQDILKSLVFYWTDEKNERINTLIEFTNDFLTKSHLTEMLTKYFVIKETEPVLMVLRPYQYYAVKNAYNRVIGSHKSGFCFHCTGSGKTLTSFLLAKTLKTNPNIDKVFFLIDRKDLDDQTVDEYNSFEEGCVDNTESTTALIRDLQDSSKPLIVTTIQKMSRALNNPKYAKVLEPYKNLRCVFIIDEAHRSNFGKMNADIRRHFQNADYIGFTGTPIFEENKGPGGRTTADLFATGSDKVNPCFHEYRIKEAIADGNVLKFSVEYMKSFESLHGRDDIDTERLNDPDYLRSKNIDVNELLHDERRIAHVADDILENLDRHIRPTGKDKYTALFAVDSIDTLMKYYDYMKENNPKDYKIAAIFTYGANDDPGEDGEFAVEGLDKVIRDYNEMFGTSFEAGKLDAYRKDVSKRMKQTKEPELDLLLVVNMFLTGWDSKPTNTLILDKNLVWHTLLQAYSRTNRVGKESKQFGQIITYRDIKKAQDDALRLFSGDGNPDDYLMETYEYFVTEYRKAVDNLREVAPDRDKAGKLQSEDDQVAYVKGFNKLAKTLATLKTFSKFQWEDLDLFMDEDEYEDYHSYYFDYYYKNQRKPSEKTSILDTIDFNIDLLRTDKINVVYILNLLKELNQKDPDSKRQGVDLILRDIERSDNEKLRFKTEILKEFINERFFELDPEDDLLQIYYDFEKEVLKRTIKEFSEENGLEEAMVDEIVNNYIINPKRIDQEMIRERLENLHLGLLKTRRLIKKIREFSKDSYDVFTAEGL